MVAIITFIALMFSFNYLKSISDKQTNEWLIYSNNATARSGLLQEIIKSIGYGGFIHNFKNAILRQDVNIIPLAQSQIDGAMNLIQAYKNKFPQDVHLMSQIEITLENYKVNTARLKGYIEQGLSVQEIDDRVRIADESATASIITLVSSMNEIADGIALASIERSHEFQLSLYIIILVTLVVFFLAFLYIIFIVDRVSTQYQRMSILFDLAPLAILAVNKDGYITLANEVAINVFQLQANKISSVNIDQLAPNFIVDSHREFESFPVGSESELPLIQKADKYNAHRLNGEVFPAHIAIAVHSFRGRKEAILVVDDISEEEKQAHEANTDPLTQLPNRRYIDTHLKGAIERSFKKEFGLYIAIIDIDWFKKINDESGHVFGDQVLTELSGYLQSSIRKTDFIGRWGGEEFLLILEGSTKEGALAVCEKLRLFVEEQSVRKGHPFTVSIGISKYIKEKPVSDFFNDADKALYLSKANGKNRTTMFEL